MASIPVQQWPTPPAADLQSIALWCRQVGDLLTARLASPGNVPGFGNITAAADIADNAVVRGDGGGKGVQGSGVIVDDSNNLTTAGATITGNATIGGTLTTTGAASVPSAFIVRADGAGGSSEGGEIRMGVSPTTTLNGTHVVLDVNVGFFRIFESGAPNRGFRLDITRGANGATSLLTPLLFQSAQQTITPAGSLTIAHGLGGLPQLIEPVLICITAEHGYSVGNELHAGWLSGANANFTAGRGITVVPDATNLNVRYGSASPVFETHNGTTGVQVSLTNANWRLVLRAWRF